MLVFGAAVPFSAWSVVILVLGTVAGLAAGLPLRRRTGWPAGGIAATVVLLSAVLALTLPPGNEQHTNGLHACLPEDLPDLLRTVLNSGGGIAGNVLNLLLLLPLTASAVLTIGRTAPAVVLAVALPPAIELAQSQIPGRWCSLSDVLTNILGALAGALLGSAVLRRRAVKHGTAGPRTLRR